MICECLRRDSCRFLLLLPIIPDLTGTFSRCRLSRISEKMVASAANVEQDHPVHDSLALILEEDRFSVTAIGTVQVVRSPECGILHEVIDDTRLFLCDGHEIVAVDERFS